VNNEIAFPMRPLLKIRFDLVTFRNASFRAVDYTVCDNQTLYNEDKKIHTMTYTKTNAIKGLLNVGRQHRVINNANDLCL